MFGYEGTGAVILRMTAIFAVSLIVVRRMGNRAVGQLSPFDFVLMVGIGDIVANVAMESQQAFFTGAEGLIGLLLLQQLLAYLSLKSKTLRKWFEGAPVTLIEDGKLLRENFIKSQFNYDDLRQELHKDGIDITDVKDIKLGRLESCGTFTIIRTPETEPLTKRDFEEYLRSIYDNPLSPQGRQWSKIEQFMDDVHELGDYVRKQRDISSNKEDRSSSQELH